MRRALPALALCACSVFLDFDVELVDGAGAIDAQVDTGPDAGDELEPNDTIAAAALLEQGGSFGPLSIRPAGDHDFFRFTTPGGANTRVEIVFVTADGDLDLRLYDAAGQQAFVSDGVVDGEAIEQPLAAGDFTAEVYGATGIQENGYTLVLVLPTP
jgi:hypothetical protein